MAQSRCAARIISPTPTHGLEPIGEITNTHLPSAGRRGAFYLTYFGWRQPGRVTFRLPDEGHYRADVIDTREMTVSPLEGAFEGEFTIPLPTKPYLAIRLVQV